MARITSSTAAPTTSVSLAALPPGDDTAITRITDGDSLVVTDDTRIRLIGIDTPEVESDDCYSAEATAHMKELVPVGTRVRLVYDVGRLDVYDRTLAYVYRLPDGLFVNLAQARDGFALQLTVPPNVAHADDLGQAVAEARTAERGLWSACSTTTTLAPPASRAPDGHAHNRAVGRRRRRPRRGAGRCPTAGRSSVRPRQRVPPVLRRRLRPDRIGCRLRRGKRQWAGLCLRDEHPGHRRRRLRPRWG